MADLVGRDARVARLRAFVDQAAAGDGRMVLLAGDPGIGKTALLTAAGEYATASGAAVAWAGCWEGDGVPGFWPWTQVVRALSDAGLVGATSADLAPLGLGSTAVDQPDEASAAARFRLFAGVLDLLRTAARTRPVVVVLDDLHWADPGSVRLLAFVARQFRHERVVILGAYRDLEIDDDHPLHDVLGALPHGAEVIRLTGLDQADVGDLLRRITGRVVPSTVVDTVRERTGGNPFLVHQVARLLGDGDTLWLTTDIGVPMLAGDAIGRRLAVLPSVSVDLLTTASAIGAQFELALLAAAGGIDQVTAARRLDAAITARIVTYVDSATYRFAHDLFREALYAGFGVDARTRTHLAIAAALDDLSGDTDARLGERARHYALALPLSEAVTAIDYAVRAARAADSRLAYEEAARHWAQAVRISDSTAATPLDPLLGLARSLLHAGSGTAARNAYLAAAEAATQVDDAIALARAAVGFHRAGTMSSTSHAQAIALLEQADEALRGLPASPLAAQVVAALARELADGLDRDHCRARDLSERAVRIARECGDQAAEAFCLLAAHDVIWGPGTAVRRLALAEEMAAAATAGCALEARFEAAFCRFIALVELADPLAEVALRDAERLADELAQPRPRYLAMSRRAMVAAMTGQYREADRLIREAGEFAEAIGEPDGVGVLATQRIMIALVRDGVAGIVDALRELTRSTGQDVMPPELLIQRRAFEHVAGGEPAAAAALLRTIPPPDDLAWYRWRVLGAAAFDIEIALACGAADVCAARYDYLLPYADEMMVIGGAVAVVGPVALYLGLAAAANQRWDDAVHHLTVAVSLADRLGARPLSARAKAELGAALLGRGTPGDRDAAFDPLTRAAEVADELDLTPVRDRAMPLLTAPRAASESAVFHQDGETWSLRYGGHGVTMRDAKGLHDLRTLLAAPGMEVPASRLLIGPSGLIAPAAGADALLDDQAKAAYRARLTDLAAEIEDAERDNDPHRAARAQLERDALITELSRAYGLGGRARRLGDPGERARSTVTARIRDVLRRIERVHPELGAHLATSVITGRSCCYRPEHPVRWQL